MRDLQDEMRRHLDAGYTMVKMKVGGLPLAEDVRRVEAVKAILPADAQLAVDANSKFAREEALAYAKVLAPLSRCWFEERATLDFALLAEIEPLPSAARDRRKSLPRRDVENLARFGGRPERNDVIQIDLPQAYGIVQHARTADMLARHGWPRRALFPHGGNRRLLAIAGGFGLGGAESYPGVFGAFGGSPTTRSSTAAISPCPNAPASASRGNRRSTPSCASSRRERELRASPRTAARCD